MSRRPHEMWGNLVTGEMRVQAADEARMAELNALTKARRCRCGRRIREHRNDARVRSNRAHCSTCDPKGKRRV